MLAPLQVILRQAVNESQLFIGNLARDSPPGGSTTTCGGITTNSVHHEDIRNFFNERLSVVERVDMNVDATSGVSRGFAFVKCR
jgi:RNA recognition motif-containing protein